MKPNTTKVLRKPCLITPKDVKECREKMWKDAEEKDALTVLPLNLKESVLDHDHKTQNVRGALHRQINCFVGKVENAFTRYIGWWYPHSLPVLLRQTANYLEWDYSNNAVHPKWIKRCLTDFGKLSSKQQAAVLKSFHIQDGKNATERKNKFDTLLKSRAVNFWEAQEEINNAKENPIV